MYDNIANGIEAFFKISKNLLICFFIVENLFYFWAYKPYVHKIFVLPLKKSCYVHIPLYPNPVDPEASEDEEDHSFVEGPKLTPEEKDKITDQVGEALEENFNSCEKAKKAAAAEKAKKDGDATDGNCVSGQDKENGDPNVKSDTFFPLFSSITIRHCSLPFPLNYHFS